TGANGVLTVNADGSYSYQANANTGGKSDSFEFVINDADGDEATTTLSVSIDGATQPPAVLIEVNEKGLGNNADKSEFADVSVAGYTIISGGQGAWGEIKYDQNAGKWVYELTKAFTHPD